MGNRVVAEQKQPELEQEAKEVVLQELQRVSDEKLQRVSDEKLEIPDISRLSKQQLLEVMNRATDELLRRIEFENTDPQQILMQQLLTVSRGNTQSMVMLLKGAAEQLGVEKRYIKQAQPEEPKTVKKLLNKTSSAFWEAVKRAWQELTFSRVLNTLSVYRFGLTPRLIYATAMWSQNPGLIGWANGAVAFGLTGRFLYVHPRILELLKTLQNPSVVDFLENIDTMVIAAALKKVLIEEIAYFLEEGPFASLRGDIATFGPFLRTSLDYIGWAAMILDWLMNSQKTTQDISNAFATWVEKKWGIFTAVLNSTGEWFTKQYQKTAEQAQKYYEQAKTKAEEMKTFVKETVQSGIDKSSKYIRDASEKIEALSRNLLESMQASLGIVKETLGNVQASVGKGVELMMDAPRKVEEMKQEMKALIKEMLGKGVQFIMDSEYRDKVLRRAMGLSSDMLKTTMEGIKASKDYSMGILGSIKNMIFGQAEQATLAMEDKVREIEKIAEKERNVPALEQPSFNRLESLPIGDTPLQLSGRRRRQMNEFY